MTVSQADSFTGEDEEVEEVDIVIPVRLKHESSITPDDQSQETFEHVQFVGFLSGFKQNNRGDIIVGITVPFRYRHFVSGIMDAHMMPIHVDVVPWTRGG